MLWLQQKPEREAGPDQHGSEFMGRAGGTFCESQVSWEGFRRGIDFIQFVLFSLSSSARGQERSDNPESP